MRDIKFRAWDKLEKIMVDNKSYVDLSKVLLSMNGEMLVGDDYCGSCGQYKYSTEENKTIELMQYTGLKDKNGADIYEGDILSTDLQRSYNIVVFKNGSFMVNCNDGDNDYYDIFYPTDEEEKTYYKYGEVIGNIYENAELLK